MKYCKRFLVAIVFLCACKANKEHSQVAVGFTSAKVTSHLMGQGKIVCDIENKEYISKMWYELNRIKPLESNDKSRISPAQANYGFIEVNLFEPNNSNTEFSIIYTRFYGVIIEYGEKYYKNDELEHIVAKFADYCKL